MPLTPDEYEILRMYLEAVFRGDETPTLRDDEGGALLAVITKAAAEPAALARLGNRALSLLLSRLTYGGVAQATSAKLFDRLNCR